MLESNKVQISYLETLKRLSSGDDKGEGIYSGTICNHFYLIQDIMNLTVGLRPEIKEYIFKNLADLISEFNKVLDSLHTKDYLDNLEPSQKFSIEADKIASLIFGIQQGTINSLLGESIQVTEKESQQLEVISRHFNELGVGVTSYSKLLSKGISS